MKKIISMAVVMTACLTANAQVSNFTGTNLGANLAMAAAGFTQTVGTLTADGVGQQNMGLTLSASHGIGMSNSAVLLFGFDYALTEIKAGSASIGAVTSSAVAKNAWTLSAAPGFLLSDSTLAYLKVGYEGAQAVNTTTGTSDSTKNITGTSLGFGIRTMVNKTSYLQVEGKQMNYGAARYDGSTADFTARGTVASIGFGVKF